MKYYLLTLLLATFILLAVFMNNLKLQQIDQDSNIVKNLQTKTSPNSKLSEQQQQQQNACINNKDPTTLTASQQLTEFIKGPCSPVILIPGIMGTSLQIQIDCEVLQKEHSEIFSSCGWQTCSSWEFWKSRPKSEYTIWIGEVFSTASIVQFTSSNTCWGNLMSLSYDTNTRKWSNPAGISVTWKGNTPETKKDSKCGNSAVSNIAASSLLSSCQTAVYDKFIRLLDGQGYQYGITYQSIPYDFRIGVNQGNTVQIIHSALRNLYKFTGKKVIIIGHSLGTIHSYTALVRAEQEFKDKYVKLFVAIAPPFLGSIQTISDHLVGNSQYTKHIYSQQIGINFINQKKFIHNSASSIYNLYQRGDAFTRFRDEEWMQDILQRIEFEDNYPKNQQQSQENQRQNKDQIPTLNYFPNPNEICRMNQNCSSGLIDLSQQCFAKVANKSYSCDSEGWISFFKEQCQEGDRQEQIYKDSVINELELLQNPGVPTAIIYSSIQNVSKNFEFYLDQLDKKNDTQFALFNNSEFGVGDGTVLSTSSIVPAIKWIWQYNNRDTLKNANYKPVKLIQYCSLQRSNNNQLFDEQDQNGEQIISKSGYQGVQCQCQNNSNNIDECSHSCMINDDQLVILINNTIFTNQKSQLNESYIQLDNELSDWQNYCPSLH